MFEELYYLLAAQASRKHFQNCSQKKKKKKIPKLLSLETLNFIPLNYSSSQSSEERSK